jgi:hypothetical protein
MSENQKSMFLARYGHEGHIDAAVSDTDLLVRKAAAGNFSATKEHLMMAIKDESPRVRFAAKQNPKAKEYGLVS